MKKLITLMSVALFSISVANAQCSAVFTATPSPANNGNVSFIDSSMALSGGSYLLSWSFGDGTSGYGSSTVHTYASSGTYYVCLTATDSISLITCSYCDSVMVIDSAAPGCTAAFTHLDSLNNVYFSNLSTGTGLTYFWDFGDGSNSTSAFPYHTYAGPGNYTVCLTVTNAAATCTNTFCDSVTVSSCGANMYYTLDSTGTVASFNSFVFGTANTYSWDFGDGSPLSTAANPVHTYTSTGTFNACLTVGSTIDASCSYTVCNPVTISSTTTCSANFVIIQDSTNLYNYWILNYASGPAGSTLSYLWNFGDSTTSALPYPMHTYSWSGPFYICLTITSSSLLGTTCTATYCDSISPGHSPSQAVTLNVINPATLGVHETATTVETLANYPNPMDNTATISYSLPANTAVELTVMDVLGNKVATLESGNKASGKHYATLDAANLSAGIYFLQLHTTNKVITRKLIVSH